MPTFLDIGKKEKIGRTFLDIEEKRQTFLDVEPKKKERILKEISQPLISEELGRELKRKITKPFEKAERGIEKVGERIVAGYKELEPGFETLKGELQKTTAEIPYRTIYDPINKIVDFTDQVIDSTARFLADPSEYDEKGDPTLFPKIRATALLGYFVAEGVALAGGMKAGLAYRKSMKMFEKWKQTLGERKLKVEFDRYLKSQKFKDVQRNMRTFFERITKWFRRKPRPVGEKLGREIRFRGRLPEIGKKELFATKEENAIRNIEQTIRQAGQVDRNLKKAGFKIERPAYYLKTEQKPFITDNIIAVKNIPTAEGGRGVALANIETGSVQLFKNPLELKQELIRLSLDNITKPVTAEPARKPLIEMTKRDALKELAEIKEDVKDLDARVTTSDTIGASTEVRYRNSPELLAERDALKARELELIPKAYPETAEKVRPEEFVERRKVVGEEKVIKEIPKEKMIIKEQIGLRRLKRYEVGRVVEDLEMSAFKIPPDDIDIKRSLENVVGTLPKEEMDAATIDVKAYMEKQSLITNGAGFIEATNIQKRQAHLQARRLHWISEKGKDKPQYRKFARLMTGKSSIKDMTYEEAQDFVEALKLLEPRGEIPAKVVTTKNLISKELADKISGFKEIGVIEEVRPAWRVFRKIGLLEEVFEPSFEAEVLSYEELMNWVKEKNRMMDAFGRGSKEDPYSAQKLFLAREQRLPKGVELTPEEGTVLAWGGRMLDKWADELNIPPEKRQNNYITHIFEAEIAKALKEKHPIPAELIRGLDFKASSSYFNPYLKKRLGEKTGLREDFWTALDIYVRKQIKYKYFDSLIKRIRIYERFLPPNSARYLRHYIARITNRPLPIDNELQQNMKELAQTIKTLPKGERLGEIMERGNFSGYLAYEFTGLLYEAFLGLYPISAIKNLSQKGLIVAECGPISFAKAKVWKLTPEGRRILKKSIVLRSRKLGFLPGIDETFLQGLNRTRRKYTLAMFKAADWDNVSDAVATGYLEAKAKGLPEDWAMKRGDEVARKTQYLYSKLASSTFAQLSGGRILGVLTTWPANWLELMMDWIKASPSDVYGKYEQLTGQRVFKETNWVKRRGSLWKYLVLVLLAGYVQRKTKFKALYYTGWTSLATLARMASGELAGLGVGGNAAKVIAGAMTGDMRMLKAGWGGLRPDKMVSVVRKLESILSGDSDWLSLFFILKKTPKYRKERAVRKLR